MASPDLGYIAPNALLPLNSTRMASSPLQKSYSTTDPSEKSNAKKHGLFLSDLLSWIPRQTHRIIRLSPDKPFRHFHRATPQPILQPLPVQTFMHRI